MFYIDFMRQSNYMKPKRKKLREAYILCDLTLEPVMDARDKNLRNNRDLLPKDLMFMLHPSNITKVINASIVSHH